MQLDSVRQLKTALAAKVLGPSAEALRRLALPGSATSALAAEPTVLRSVALGVARKGSNDFLLAVRIQERALEGSREVELIRRQAKGEVDVRYVGAITKRATAWHQQSQRPLMIGSSIGHFKITAGTVGAFVRQRPGGPICLLSNNHVLANENRARKGDSIVQPARHDGGQDPANRVAVLRDFVRLKKVGSNLMDAAIGEVLEGVDTDLTQLKGLGKLKGVGEAFLDEGTKVAKLGRTTGLTRGRVTAFELDNVVVRLDLGLLRFDNQIEVESAENVPFSVGGDSGALVVGEDLRAVGLLFAGGDIGGANGQGLTYINPMHTVLAAMKLELALV